MPGRVIKPLGVALATVALSATPVAAEAATPVRRDEGHHVFQVMAAPSFAATPVQMAHGSHSSHASHGSHHSHHSHASGTHHHSHGSHSSHSSHSSHVSSSVFGGTPSAMVGTGPAVGQVAAFAPGTHRVPSSAEDDE